MDFWDLTRLLLRRWYFAVPALALTAIASVWTLVDVSPNYIATAFVQLAPPTSKPTVPGEQSLDQRNPWIGLGTYNLANAAILTVQQQAVVEALKASGYSASFTASLNSSSPLVTFEVTGSSRQQAIDTTDELIRRFNASVKDLQVGTYGVSESDLVVARRIDSGTNVEESDGRVKRALVAVAGLGFLLTLAFTVGLDAMLARRARRRVGLPAGVGIADLSPPVVRTTAPPSSRLSSGRDDGTFSFGVSPRPDIETSTGSGGARQRQPGHLTASIPSGATEPSNGFISPVPLAATPDATVDADADGADDGHSERTIAQADATVVLPLTYRSFRRREADEEGHQPR